MATISPVREVHRHAQDSGQNCGRASAQMVISSLVQGPKPGDLPTAGQLIAPIAVTQAALQSREADPIDNVLVPSWYTHPDELVALLKNAPELNPPNPDFSDWHIVSRSTLNALLNEVVAALQRGVPPIININTSDHWVVVSGARLTAAGKLKSLDMFDPMPVSPITHTYADSCAFGFDGVLMATFHQTKAQLGDLDLQIGNVPPPAGMTNFSGQFVAVVHGTNGSPRPSQPLVRSGNANHHHAERQSTDANEHPLVAELRAIAADWEVPQLTKLLNTGAEPVIRTVKDINGSAEEYTLLSMFSARERYGVAAVFDAGSETRLKHLRFTRTPLLPATVDPTLWFTRDPLPSLGSPYFPFTRHARTDGTASYTRLIDRFVIDAPRSRG